MGRLLGLSWLLAICFALGSHLNHSRFWWQELVCSLTPYWIPLVGLGFLVTLYSYFRGRLRLLYMFPLIVLQGALLCVVGELALPYLYFDRWPALSGERVTYLGVLVAPGSGEESLAQHLSRAVRAYRPDVLVVLGASAPSLDRGGGVEELPFRAQHVEIKGRGVRMLSRFPMTGASQESVGFAALPAMYQELQLPDGELIHLGALSLSPFNGQDGFEDNKVTARRLATLVRNSTRHRIVVGAFCASSFAKSVSMYVRQGRLRSVMFGRALHGTLELESSLFGISSIHAFVSKYVRVDQLVPIQHPAEGQQGMFFLRVALPLTR